MSVKLCKYCFFSFVIGISRSSSSFFSVVENSVFSKVGRSEAVRDELNEQVDDEHGRTDSESDEPLFPGETSAANFEDHSSGLSNNDLKANDTEPDSKEYPVVTHARENVLFIVDHARAEHVELLEDNEGGEEESEVARGTTGEEASTVLVRRAGRIVINPFTVNITACILG